MDLEKGHKTDIQVQVDPATPIEQPTRTATSGSVKKSKSIPYVGLIALLYAAGSVLITFGVLKAIDHKKAWNISHVKPASILSAILSTTSVALHVAMNSGLNVYWWRQARKSGATAGDLHNTWEEGTSVMAAVKGGILSRKFSYMAVATLFIASIPLNGLMLQSAITTAPDPQVKPNTWRVPFVSEWWTGYSATYNAAEGLTLGSLNEEFSAVVASWQNFDGNANAWDTYVNDIPVANYTVSDFDWKLMPSGKFKVRGVGLKPTCSMRSEPFDLRTETLRNNSDYSKHNLFSSTTAWDASINPNAFNISIMVKGNEETEIDPAHSTYCVGNFSIMDCTLEVYETEYNAQLIPVPWDSGSEFTQTAGSWYLGLDNSTTWSNDTHIKSIPVPEVPSAANSTTYGGLSTVFDNFVGNFTIKLLPDNSSVVGSQAGSFALTLQKHAGYNSDTGLIDLCETNFAAESAQPFADQIFNSLRKLMFSASAMQGVMSSYARPGTNPPIYDAIHVNYAPTFQSVIGTAVATANVYQIAWKYYFASLAVTLVIVLVITPSFIGFWELPRKTTLSPLETARLFNAPIVHDIDEHEDMKLLLNNVGNKKVNRGSSIS